MRSWWPGSCSERCRRSREDAGRNRASPGNRSTNPTQDLLAGQKERWNALPPERQRAMADGAERWLSMNDADRTRRASAGRSGASLTPAERERLRERWKRFRELTPEQKDSPARKLPALHVAAARTARRAARALAADDARGTAPRDPAPPRPEPARVDKRPCPPAEDSHPARGRGRIFPRCRTHRSSARMTG